MTGAAIRISLFAVAILLGAIASKTQQSPEKVTNYGKATWTVVEPGHSSGELTFRQDGTVLYHEKVVYKWELKRGGFQGTPTIRFAPPAPHSGQIAILRWDESRGGIGGLLLDSHSGRVTAAEVLPHLWTVVQWASWSPDGRFVLFVASGEVTMGDMILVDGISGKIQEIHYRDFTRDHGRSELQLAGFESLEWLSPNRYLVPITVRCNMYEAKDCEPSRVLSKHIAEVDVPSLAMHYSIPQPVK